MSTFYNRFAGESVERLAALSDGVFAVAMTLLVFNLTVPQARGIHTEAGLWHALANLAPHMLTYFMSFLTLGIFWIGQQTQLNHLSRSDRDLAWIHFCFLLVVTLIPFTTGFLATFIGFRVAVVVYWLGILLLGLTLLAGWRYATHAKLVKDDITPDRIKALERRILVAEALYALGALLCLLSVQVSIGFIILVQLNYVFAPRIGPLYRL
jgi:uncharacterized membrane protein